MIMKNYLQERRETYENYIEEVVKYYKKHGDISKVHFVDSYENDGYDHFGGQGNEHRLKQLYVRQHFSDE